MKTISIRELHQSTGKIVRSVAEEPAVVTDHGRPLAVIRALCADELPGQPLPPSHWESQSRPVIEADSTVAVSSDRSG